MSPPDAPDEDVPPNWTVEERDDDVRSWLGPEERVICAREGEEDRWLSYAEPRSELGTTNRTPLTAEETGYEEALAAAQDYMRRNTDDE